LGPNANSNEFKQVQIFSNFDRPTNDLFELEKIKIKYGCEVFEERNNFLHMNFFTSEVDSE
jgi:hypothetical protein